MIAIPILGDGKEQFWNCLDELRSYTHSKGISTIKIQRKGSAIHHARNLLVCDARKFPLAKHILWLDTDQAFERDLLLRLLEHDKDVVVANIYRKNTPYVPVVSVWKEDEKRLAPIHIDPEEGILRRVSAGGTGVCLTRTSVFTRLPFPWFEMKYVPTPEWISTDTPEEKIIEGHIFLGEDVGFFMALQLHDIKVYCDFSIVVGHVGDHIFTYQDFLNTYKDEPNERDKSDDPGESAGSRRIGNQ